MKLKKIIGVLIAILILAIAIGTTSTYATNSSYILGITNIREDKGAYGLNRRSDGTVEKKIWKIVSYPSKGSNVINYDNAFYCLKAEHGFMSNTTSNVIDIKKTYDQSFNMKTQKQEVMTRLNAIEVFKTDPTAYNKVMWILDNMYLPKAQEAKDFKVALLAAAGITTEDYTVEKVRITDADIEVVQQMAIWYFTNPDSPYYNGSTNNGKLPMLYFNDWSGKDATYENFEDLYNDKIDPDKSKEGRFRQEECELLYRYFIDNAKTKESYISNDVTAPLTLDKSRVTIAKLGAEYVVGPFKINHTEGILYTLKTLGFVDGENQEITYKLLDASKNEVKGDITSLYGQDFYIAVPTTTTIKTIKFNIALTYTKTDATYYTTNVATYKNEQPVVLVERAPQEYKDEVVVNIPEPEAFDLALRKFISKVNEIAPQTSREPVVDLTNLKTGASTTATYDHPKVPLSVKAGDIITYTIRVYNEGRRDGYVKEITDYLPKELEFLPEDEENISNGWYYDENDITLRTIKTNHLSRETDTDNLVKAFDGITLSYQDITIKCKLKGDIISGQKITNIADITGFTDEDGKIVKDIDSQEKNILLPTDEDLPNYKDNEIDRGDKYIQGQQDDDDFEKVKVQIFDLALRKFITKVDNQNITNRIPSLSIAEEGNIKYNHTKVPVEVQTNNIVTYTLRIFNEGDMDGYAKSIVDDIPSGLQFIPEHETNQTYRWKMLDDKGNETTDITKAVKIITDYLAKEQEKQAGENLIKAFNKEAEITDSNPDYRDVKLAFKVIEPNTSDKILTNTAEIADDSDVKGNPIDDVDSIPGNNKPGEDDIDVEHVKLIYFDLALRKFITKVDNLAINNRVPALSIKEDGKIEYTHTKEPVEVEQTNLVTYTLRIYNEGKIAGYAKEVTDNLPIGLEFLPDNESNKEYRWKMIDKEGKETLELAKAVKITTDYLAKEQEKIAGSNLIKPFNKELGITDSNPDYRDVKIIFKVIEPNTSDRIIINTAEISDDTDKDNKPVEDVDSIPGNNIPGEDDIDIEKVKVKYFDLALKKWVSQAIVIENGKQTITETGHTGNENPEPIVKVDLKDKDLKKVTVKFRYKIKVTNEGQIAGYVKEIKDYIPEGLKFVADDNPKWKLLSEKIAVTAQTENILLKPGESTTVEILLTWINGEDNLKLQVNVAEISKDYNDSHTPDIDSTPDNKKPGEDDIDDAPVILAIKTGETEIYIGLTTIILVTLAGGIYLIKKFVL